jgi:RNA polymerase sigma-70 factor (ECF subfamily)
LALRLRGVPPVSSPPVPSNSAGAKEQTRWFTDEVYPHDSSLRLYLKGAFPAVRDVDDLVQESYLRLLKARAAQPINCARAFLFGVARRLAIDAIRRKRRVTHREVTMDLIDLFDEKADAAELNSTRQELELLADAIHSLPRRCREIMILRKLEHLPHREIAARLGISVSTVEVQLARGMEKCAAYLRAQGVRGPLR